MTAEPTAPAPAPALESWPERTPYGAAWRGTVTLLFTVVGMAASGWLGSLLIRYDSRLVTGTTGPVAVVVGALTIGWLRAHNIFAFPTMLGSLLGAQAFAYLLDDNAVSLHAPYLAQTSTATYEAAFIVVGTAAALGGIVWATVGGFRDPRPFKPEKES
ncbi:hypothetical protein [Streptomyces aquilus]|uniref:hypothetical protein n=1 Tax=Streptomyces aquilus TaxID=2548456 RepID=UPI00368642A0